MQKLKLKNNNGKFSRTALFNEIVKSHPQILKAKIESCITKFGDEGYILEEGNDLILI